MKKIMTIMVTVVMMMAMMTNVMASTTIEKNEFSEEVTRIENEMKNFEEEHKGFVKDYEVKSKYYDNANAEVRYSVVTWNNVNYSFVMQLNDGEHREFAYMNDTYLPTDYVNDYFEYAYQQYQAK